MSTTDMPAARESAVSAFRIGGGLVVGLGNTLLTDDAVGPAVARRVQTLLAAPDVELRELAVGGVELMETLAGSGWAVVIDAIRTEGGTPGACYRIDLESAHAALRVGMSHEIGLLEGLALGRRLGLVVPERLWLYAVEVEDPFTFGARMTPRVEAAVARAAETIAREVSAERAVEA